MATYNFKRRTASRQAVSRKVEGKEPGTADKAVNLEGCKSPYRQLPESDG